MLQMTTLQGILQRSLNVSLMNGKSQTKWLLYSQINAANIVAAVQDISWLAAYTVNVFCTYSEFDSTRLFDC